MRNGCRDSLENCFKKWRDVVVKQCLDNRSGMVSAEESQRRQTRDRREKLRPGHLNTLHRFLNGNNNVTFRRGGTTVEKITNNISLPILFAMCDSAHHINLLQLPSQDIEDEAEFWNRLA